MKLLGVIGTTGLFFLLGATAAAYAALDPQEPGDKPEKQEEKAKPEKQEKQSQPVKQEAKQPKQEQDKPAKQEAKQAKQEQDKSTKQEAKQEQNDKHAAQQDQQSAQQSQRDAGNRGGGEHGRISDDHYRTSFGSGHNFHVNRGDYDHRRFQYGGYSFGFIDPWPADWYYTDNVYVVYDDGCYYMCDAVHPGIRISINIL